ncbi:hypothetical protein [Haloimpatiens lingqiaonensis]|nr:hypothetical protein [Haloimpatiens lingqiaonensis]
MIALSKNANIWIKKLLDGVKSYSKLFDYSISIYEAMEHIKNG